MNYIGGRRNGSGGFIMSFWFRFALFLGILFGLLSVAAARERSTARTRTRTETTASSLSSRSTHQRNYRNKKRWNYLRHRRLRQQLRTRRQGQKHDDAGSSSSSLSLSPEQETRDVNGNVLDDDVQPQEPLYHENPPRRQLDTSTTIVYYVHSELGRDTNTGTNADGAVRTIQQGLNLIRKAIQNNKQKTPSTPQNTHTPTTVILELTGTFSFENIVLTEKYSVGDKSTSTIDRFIIRGSDTNKKKATILGGQELDFVKVSSLDVDHPARQLATLTGVADVDVLLAAPFTPRVDDTTSGRWTDGNCREDPEYVAPPTLSISTSTPKKNNQHTQHYQVLTRAREPNLPLSLLSSVSFDQNTNAEEDDNTSMGEVFDAWMRTEKRSSDGQTYVKASDRASMMKASNLSWNSGTVSMHIFPLVDWFDARVPVGTRHNPTNNKNVRFDSVTNQQGPGNPNEDGGPFVIAKEARYYLEGAIDYLDQEGEYYVSYDDHSDRIPNSRGWTLLYPPQQLDFEDNTTDDDNDDDDNDDNVVVSAVLSLSGDTLFEVDADGVDMHVTIENIQFEGSRRYLGSVYGNEVAFRKCNFVNAGYDAVEVYGHRVTFDACTFEGAGGSSIRLSDDRDYDMEGPAFGLLSSRNVVMNSLLSNFASTCRHYSEGVAIGGYGSIVANNHFRSSNMASIDIVGGGTKLLYNVFSHISDGSYDDGAIHWVSESPMERGTEVGYNLFFRNGVSTEPCNAETSCYQADMYFDDFAGAMAIYGNVMIKDKIVQEKPPSAAYAVINWLGILVNGGADVTVYDNTYYGPVDYDDKDNSPIYNGQTVLYEQTCGGTIWPDGNKCGRTGICKNDEFYKRMRQYGYNKSPWSQDFPELLKYNANPSNSNNWYCADTQSCPVAAWNQTVVCNAAVGSDRDSAHRVMWPSDRDSQLKEDAIEGRNVPYRKDAVIERGNKKGLFFAESVATIDVIEKQGIAAVIELAKRIAIAGESEPPEHNTGTRKGAARLDFVGRMKNPCTGVWLLSGSLDGCDPCDKAAGTSNCAPRDLPSNNSCNSNHDDESPSPRPTTSSPVTTPPALEPTINPADDSNNNALKCYNSPKFRVNKSKNNSCEKWLKTEQQQNKRCEKKWRNKKVRKWCPELCNYCPTGCNNCNKVTLSYKFHKKKGYCDHGSEKETKKTVKSPKQCWNQCRKEFQRSYAEFTDGTCYCTKKCPCMSSIGETNIVSITPRNFQLPKQC